MRASGVYAGFWIRLSALAIDSALEAAVAMGIAIALAFTSLHLIALAVTQGVIILLIDMTYEIATTARWGGTLGKLTVGIRVAGEDGKRISYARSAGRYFAKILSTITLFIGYLMVAWDERKQGMHDKIAKTFVYRANGSKRANAWTKAGAIAGWLTVAGYIGYLTVMACAAAFGTLTPLTHHLDGTDPAASALMACDQWLDIAHDSCLEAYRDDDLMKALDATQRIELCDRYRDQDLRAQCVQRIAIEQRNPAPCNERLSGYRARNCARFYGFASWAQAAFQPPHDGTPLTVQEVIAGRSADGACEPVEPLTLTSDDRICISIRNISGFAQNPINRSDYRFDILTFDSAGNLIGADRDLFPDDHKVHLPGGVKEEEFVTWDLGSMRPGNYTLQLGLYDNIGRGSWERNISLGVDNAPSTVKADAPRLLFDRILVGIERGNDCVEREPTYDPTERICYMPLNLSGLERDSDGLYWFDADSKTRNAGGELVDYSRHIFGEDGHVLLADGVLNSATNDRRQWVRTNLSTYARGLYREEVVFYDRVGDAATTFNITFHVS